MSCTGTKTLTIVSSTGAACAPETSFQVPKAAPSPQTSAVTMSNGVFDCMADLRECLSQDERSLPCTEADSCQLDLKPPVSRTFANTTRRMFRLFGMTDFNFCACRKERESSVYGESAQSRYFGATSSRVV